MSQRSGAHGGVAEPGSGVTDGRSRRAAGGAGGGRRGGRLGGVGDVGDVGEATAVVGEACPRARVSTGGTGPPVLVDDSGRAREGGSRAGGEGSGNRAVAAGHPPVVGPPLPKPPLGAPPHLRSCSVCGEVSGSVLLRPSS